MILSCQNIVKSFGTDVIIKGGSFHIEENERLDRRHQRRRKDNSSSHYRRRIFSRFRYSNARKRQYAWLSEAASKCQ